MITPEKITEWLKEVEERPSSGSIIIQYIANRLSELTKRNEELLAENIELRSGRKVEDFESRIANLEYQLDLLKRQLGSADLDLEATLAGSAGKAETASLVIYTPAGKVLRLEVDLDGLVSGNALAAFDAADMPAGETLADGRAGLLATNDRQELLFVFNSGRTLTAPVSSIPAAASPALSWQNAMLQEPRGLEELAFVIPIGRMALCEFAIQASRRGYVKKIKRPLLESYISKDYIGAGVKLPADRTCALTLCRESDLFCMVSREGFCFSIPAPDLPFAVEEALRLGTADHIVDTFALPASEEASAGISILALTRTGKLISRLPSWLEPARSFKSHGQPLFSKERRISGVRVAAAVPARAEDWGLALWSDGRVTAHKIADLSGSGALPAGLGSTELVEFAVLSQSGN